ncbi:hypothetical protein GN244_ATG12800 [Phytophthora infestans]|uniref:Uncharacterized protein n=1 Tax=Phytophthora infestans TaxID=4787 RepID=A0A833SLP3_PHYIN|nr:hypothetical protein GN244_ATG12800 [Phytophthora infestans]KAF4129787.1 hypothetical protein GN958_ATG21022 [Phytophthora infestans]
MGSSFSSAAPMSQIDFESYKGLRYTTVSNTGDATHGPTFKVPSTVPVDEEHQTLHYNFLCGLSREEGTRRCYGRCMADPVSQQVGTYRWLTYADVKTRMDDLASGMTHAFMLKR